MASKIVSLCPSYGLQMNIGTVLQTAAWKPATAVAPTFFVVQPLKYAAGRIVLKVCGVTVTSTKRISGQSVGNAI